MKEGIYLHNTKEALIVCRDLFLMEGFDIFYDDDYTPEHENISYDDALLDIENNYTFVCEV